MSIVGFYDSQLPVLPMLPENRPLGHQGELTEFESSRLEYVCTQDAHQQKGVSLSLTTRLTRTGQSGKGFRKETRTEWPTLCEGGQTPTGFEIATRWGRELGIHIFAGLRLSSRNLVMPLKFHTASRDSRLCRPLEIGMVLYLRKSWDIRYTAWLTFLPNIGYAQFVGERLCTTPVQMP